MTVDNPEPKRRSPLKREPLRLPGQSIEDARRAERERIEEPLLMVVFAWSLVVHEWASKSMNVPRMPVLYTFVAVICTVWAIPRILAYRRRDADYKLGRQGELEVAESLEALRAQGFRPLHDIVAGRFNVDHILIGPSGVFAIETKTRRKSGGREEKIQVDGSRILVGGRIAEPNPVEQAKANAAWVGELLSRSTGRRLKVEPVVIFPGWWVEFIQKPNGLFVMNEKGLENIIAKLPVVLSAEEVAMAAFHLEQFVRTASTNSDPKL